MLRNTLVFDDESWEKEYNEIKSELFTPELPIQQHVLYIPFTSNICRNIKKWLTKAFIPLARTGKGRILLHKAVHNGLSVYSVSTVPQNLVGVHQRDNLCCISRQTVDLAIFKLRTVKRTASDGVVSLGETGYMMVTRLWLNCIQSILIVSRLQRYIKHYATLDIQGQLNFKQQIALKNRINGAIRFTFYMFATLIQTAKYRRSVLKLVE